LWDFETGAAIFEYGEAHDDSAITCMTFDNTARRLITGGRDGTLKIWNYNNGHCLKILKKGKLAYENIVKYFFHACTIEMQLVAVFFIQIKVQ
jgi:WD40 repeat protein